MIHWINYSWTCHHLLLILVSYLFIDDRPKPRYQLKNTLKQILFKSQKISIYHFLSISYTPRSSCFFSRSDLNFWEFTCPSLPIKNVWYNEHFAGKYKLLLNINFDNKVYIHSGKLAESQLSFVFPDSCLGPYTNICWCSCM